MARTIPAEFKPIGGPLPLVQVTTTDLVTEGQNQNYTAAHLCGLMVQQGLCEQRTRWYIRETAGPTDHCYWRIPKPPTTYTAATVTAYVWARVDSGSGTVTLAADATTASVAVTATSWTVHAITVTLPATAADYYLLTLSADANTANQLDLNSVSIELGYGSGATPTGDGGFVYLEDARSDPDAPLSVHRERLKAANCAELLTERLGMLLAWSDDYQTESNGAVRTFRMFGAWDAPAHVIRDLPCRVGPNANNIRIDFIGLATAATATVKFWTDNNYDSGVTANITNTVKTTAWTSVDLPIKPTEQARTVKLWAEITPAAVGEGAMLTNICAWEEVSP